MLELKALLLTQGMHGMVSQVEGLAKALGLSYKHQKIELKSFWNLIPPKISPISENLVKNRNSLLTDTITEFNLSNVVFPAKLFYILSASKLCVSSGEGRRQIQGGSVRLEGEKILDVNLVFDNPEQLDNKVLQVGKTKFTRLVSR